MDYEMIPSVDMTEYEKLAKQLRAHPLYKRSGEIQQAFLDDLTRLTRKYGLELSVTTRNSYGETYPDCELKAPYKKGTEARYVFNDYNGIDFTSVKAGDALPCSKAERQVYEEAARARKEEEEAIWNLNRQISNAYDKAMEKGRNEMMTRNVERMKMAKKPTSVSCSCGDKFKTEAKLKKHAEDTGHAA